MAKITASVGRAGGVNRKGDVITVQTLINNVPSDLGGPVKKLMTDGFCGQKTIDAIQKFQLQHFGWSGADGRVDPEGPTIFKLSEFEEKPAPNPFPPLTNHSMLLCPHGGRITVLPKSFSSVEHRNGTRFLKIDDHFIIAGCPFQTPCVRVNWVYSPNQIPDSRSIGLCLNSKGVVQGTVMIVFA